MDLRIVNTCNNNCLYCLEQPLRWKEPFISKEKIFNVLKDVKEKNLTFYGWNPLLHPDLMEIVLFASKVWFKNIGILTNTFWLDKYNLIDFKKNNLTTFGVYFNSFDKEKHSLLVGKEGIKLRELLSNIKFLKSNKFFVKIIIYVNKQNIENLYKDVIILATKFKINRFEFINYFPFDRPYEKYHSLLGYLPQMYTSSINTLFKTIKHLKLTVNFAKFPKTFFWNNIEYYNFQRWIVEQIWEEDEIIINWNKVPFCKTEWRCEFCFLQDYCKRYGI